MNNKGFWEQIILIPLGLLVLYLMLITTDPILDLLFPMLDNTDIFPLGWVAKLVIQLLPIIVVILLIVRMQRSGRNERV